MNESAPVPTNKKEAESTPEVKPTVVVELEQAADFDAIDELTRQAFGKEGDQVAEQVHLIRASPNYMPDLSLVARQKGEVVGHIMLSHLPLSEGSVSHQVLTLSPVSVRPDMQKQGVGSALIKAAVEKADQMEEPLIVLEGHPDYYPRFGFKPAAKYGVSIDLPSWAPPEAAMVLPLSHYDDSIRGKVVYPPAFDHDDPEHQL